MTQRKTDKNESEEMTVCCSGLAELLSPQLFKALSDPKRLSLLVRIADEGCPCTVSHVAKGSNVDMSVVSRHLAILREAGIIRCEKQGKEVLCTLETDMVVRVLRQIADAMESCCPGKGLLDRSSDDPSPVLPATRPSRRKQP